MRETGVWTYALVNLFHILGVATLFGSVLILDLRLLGAWRSTPLRFIAGPATRIAGLGFGLAAITGAGLLATKATEYADNPFLWIKFAAIALALLNVAITSRSPAWRASLGGDSTARNQSRLSLLGGISLVCWLAAVAAGRMIGYW
jgi:hypothetical protein